jgi:hypothetical protein
LTLPNLVQFLEEQLSFPIKYISTESDVEIAKARTNVSSLFILRLESTADGKAEVVTLAARQVRAHNCVFVGCQTNVTRFEVFRSPTFSLPYTGDWTLSSLSSFIAANRDCLLPPLSTHMENQELKPHEMYCIIFLLPDMYDELAKMIEPVKSDIRFFYEVYSPNARTVNKFRVQRKSLPQWILVDGLTSRFAIIKANSTSILQNGLDSRDLLKWRFAAPDGVFESLRLDWLGSGYGRSLLGICLDVAMFLSIHLWKKAGRRNEIGSGKRPWRRV